MCRYRARWLLPLVLGFAGCVSTPPIKPDAAPKAEPKAVAVQVLPEQGGMQLLAAIDLMSSEQYLQAEANLAEISRVRPDLTEAHFNLGWVRHRLRKYKEAINALDVGLLLSPNSVPALNLKAICQRQLGLFPEAEKTYLAALAISPGDENVLLNLGILYDLYLFMPQEALASYQHYLRVSSDPDARVAGWIALIERKESK